MRILGLVALAAMAVAAEPLPRTEAETLSGRKVAMPDLFGGKPAVLVWSFSKEAGEKTAAWMAPLAKEGVNAYSVAMLEAAPRFVRGFIKSGMKQGMTPQQQDRMLLLYAGEKAWRTRLGLKDEKQLIVVVVNARGEAVWAHEGAYDGRKLAEVKEKTRD
jgi:hypothetical protein